MKKTCTDCKLYHMCVVVSRLNDAANHFVPLSKNKGIYVEVQALIAKDCTMFEKINDDTAIETVNDENTIEMINDENTIVTINDYTTIETVHYECQDCGALEMLPTNKDYTQCVVCGSKDVAIIDLNNSSECEKNVTRISKAQLP